MYSVKEIFYSLQGEGAMAGRPGVFCRFTGCNLWSGREQDRSSAACNFCDTDFIGVDGPGGGKFATPAALAQAVKSHWPAGHGKPFVICTGGEPLLQLDSPLVEAFKAEGFEVAIETNGTLAPPPGIDWVCVSPKGSAPLQLTRGDELKLVYPQADARPEQFAGLAFEHFFLQPEAGQAGAQDACIQYCLEHPQWRLSLQTHKLIGIP
ncbi:7-carboxy-7-deazaguanine synthase [Motiliproteus sp. SC1-56]|uniref:7-carboxy-7-deazaguanine synthase n=1 Tax=Motiliproteus sp. SC1-56 TaxID=2799565 RepID=UPI001A8CB92C|nr:7-carboxy-7-deazaguanine synthase [Motiliproteus sp. SC1-56]